jgi:malate dehydrogenase
VLRCTSAICPHGTVSGLALNAVGKRFCTRGAQKEDAVSKVTVIGAGFVGATVAQHVAECDIADVVSVDIVEGLPQGKALDLMETAPLFGHDRKIFGTNDYKDTKNSDIVVITSGIARKPGMSRDDLLKINADIVKKVSEDALKHSPEAIFITVTNPLDVMTYLTWKTTKLPHQRVIGMAGVLDSARFQAFIGMELNLSVRDIRAMVLGGHGDLMVPLPRYSTVNGVPITELLSPERVEALSKRTRNGGAEIVDLLKTGSAFYAPGASVAQMVGAILRDENRLLPCCVYADGQFGLKDVYVGLPAVLGHGGVKRLVELKLTSDESAALKKSADSIKENIDAMNKLLCPV